MHEQPARALGIDGCERGWVGVTLDGNQPARGFFAPRISELVELAGPVDAVGVDIPIGLGVDRERQADLEAAWPLGGRRSSLFMTPIRAALLAETHAEASDINRRATGKGISQQAFALRKKIFEVEEWVVTTGLDVREVHPEVSFAILMDGPATHPKKSWAGMQERVRVRHNLSRVV